MWDLIYWAGQFTLLFFEIVGMAFIVILPLLWLAGAFLEFDDRILKKRRINKYMKEINNKYANGRVYYDKDKRKDK